MNPLEPRVAGAERRLEWLYRWKEQVEGQFRRLQQALRELEFAAGGGGGLPGNPETAQAGLALVTTDVQPGTAAAPGAGAGTLVVVNDLGLYAATTLTGVPLFNNNEKTVKVSATGFPVVWVLTGGRRFVVVPGKCADLA